MSDDLTFGGGVPTQPDVKRLVDHFGVPVVGVLLRYEDIAKVTHTVMGSHRYNTIVAAWRRALEREHEVVLQPVRGRKAYERATDNQRIHGCGGKFKSHLRGISRAGDRALRTPTENLGPSESKAREHIIRTSVALRMAAAAEARRLKAPVPSLKPKDDEPPSPRQWPPNA